MPINSFDNYPMNWKPQKELLSYPFYRSLAERLEQDIKNGTLSENTKLPPQRELADYLDINFTTVTKAYKLCEEKGLIYAIVGKGTFVSPHIGVRTTVVSPKDNSIEMGMVLPFDEDNHRIRKLAQEILSSNVADQYFDYSFPHGNPFQKRMVVNWLSHFGCETDEEHILITAGSQNALSITLASLFEAGDKIATDCYTYPNFIGLANMLKIKLVSISLDAYGMSSIELDKYCRTNGLKGVYLMPSISNPTNLSMNMKRREEIAAVIRKYGLLAIEDDSYSFLSETYYPPIVLMVKENTIYINGFSKHASSGLRVAALSTPDSYKSALEQGFYNFNLKTPSLNMEIAARMVQTGLYQEMLTVKKERSRIRNEHYKDIMGDISHDIHPYSYYQWLPLPTNCTGKAFEAMMATQGIRVYGSERFSIGEIQKNHFVRITTSSPQSIEQLRKGLTSIKKSYLELTQEDNSFIV